MENDLRLTIELVPRTSWFNNIRKIAPKAEWDRIRKATYARYGRRCGIRGAGGRLNCHEIWSYDDRQSVQRLDGFIALCDLCHHVKHLGFAGVLAARGELDMERVVRHFMKVNRCTKEYFERRRGEAFELWSERSQCEWTVDFGEYEYLRPRN